MEKLPAYRERHRRESHYDLQNMDLADFIFFCLSLMLVMCLLYCQDELCKLAIQSLALFTRA
jgi:hypothetical protein